MQAVYRAVDFPEKLYRDRVKKRVSLKQTCHPISRSISPPSSAKVEIFRLDIYHQGASGCKKNGFINGSIDQAVRMFICGGREFSPPHNTRGQKWNAIFLYQQEGDYLAAVFHYWRARGVDLQAEWPIISCAYIGDWWLRPIVCYLCCAQIRKVLPLFKHLVICGELIFLYLTLLVDGSNAQSRGMVPSLSVRRASQCVCNPLISRRSPLDL